MAKVKLWNIPRRMYQEFHTVDARDILSRQPCCYLSERPYPYPDCVNTDEDGNVIPRPKCDKLFLKAMTDLQLEAERESLSLPTYRTRQELIDAILRDDAV